MNNRLPRLKIALAATLFGGSLCAWGQTLTVLYSFGFPPDGTDPMSGVVMDAQGSLYGTASVGGVSNNGLVYELSPPAVPGALWNETILRRFSGPDGSIPECRLVLSSDGSLFGTTLNGGVFNAGAAFQLVPPKSAGDPWSERLLHSFGGPHAGGLNPNQGLLAGKSAFFGVTFGGGTDGKGTVFLLSQSTSPAGGWTETTLHSFHGGNDGAFPSSELMMDSAGNLYGTTTLGGASDLGTVFQLHPPSAPGREWHESVLHAFSGADGSSPAGRLQLGTNGVVYGTASGGGTLQGGAVFQLNPPAKAGADWTYSVLYNFTGGRDGGSPMAGVSLDATGRLYGAAAHGGQFTGGGIFRLDPPPAPGGSWTYSLLHSFSHLEGFVPESRLTLTSHGIFGTASEGGEFGIGSVFVLIP